MSKRACVRQEDKELKKRQTEYAVSVLLRKLPNTDEYDMGWWRTCPDTEKIQFTAAAAVLPPVADTNAQGIFHPSPTAEYNSSEAVDDSAPSDIQEDRTHEPDVNAEITYGLFRNSVASEAWETFQSVLSGTDSGDVRECRKGWEFSILLLARVDAWIVTVLQCLGLDGLRGGKCQRLYIETFSKNLPVAMRQLTSRLHNFVKDWEPGDLELPVKDIAMDEEDHEELEKKFLGKVYNACVPVLLPSMKKFFIAIQPQWFYKYVGSELGQVQDCYIAEVDIEQWKVRPCWY